MMIYLQDWLEELEELEGHDIDSINALCELAFCFTHGFALPTLLPPAWYTQCMCVNDKR